MMVREKETQRHRDGVLGKRKRNKLQIKGRGSEGERKTDKTIKVRNRHADRQRGTDKKKTYMQYNDLIHTGLFFFKFIISQQFPQY